MRTLLFIRRGDRVSAGEHPLQTDTSRPSLKRDSQSGTPTINDVE
jgi:hypothetical protein